MKIKLTLFFIGLFLGEMDGQIDSISLRGYSNGTFEIMLNNQGELKISQMNAQSGSLGYFPIIRGYTKKAQVDVEEAKKVFDYVNLMLEVELRKNIQDSAYADGIRTHTAKAKFDFYEKGALKFWMTEYEYDPVSKIMESLYLSIKRLTSLEQSGFEYWDTAELDEKILEGLVVDSIRIEQRVTKDFNRLSGGKRKYKHLNYTWKKYPVKKGRELNLFLEELKRCKQKINPLKNGEYKNIYEVKNHYQIIVYSKNRVRKVLKFDGKYFRSKFFMWFKSNKAIKRLIFQQKESLN